MGRYKELESLRFLFALIVVIGHAAGWKNTIAGGYLAVDFFFVLSGFVLTRAITISNRSFGEFAIDRIARLLPMHWLTLLIMVLVLVFAGWTTWFTIPEFFINASLLQSITSRPTTYNWPAWSISVELIVNFAIFFWLARKRFGFTAIATIAISGVLIAFPVFTPSNSSYLLRGVYGLMLGYAAFEISIYLPKCQKTTIYVAITIAFVALTTLIVTHPSRVSMTIVAPTSAFLIVALTSGDNIISKILAKFSYFGIISYAMYLIHAPMILLCRSYGYLGLDQKENYSGTLTQLILLIVAVIIVSGFLYELFERPARRMILTVAKRREKDVMMREAIGAD